MDTESILQAAEALLQPWAKSVSRVAPDRLDAVLEASDLVAVVSAMVQAHMGYLVALTSLDHPGPSPDTGTLEVLYFFAEGAANIVLRVSLPYEEPAIPTLCGVLPQASLYEREMRELFGIEVIGTPDTARLVLSDDWPEGVYPLRKSFKGF